MDWRPTTWDDLELFCAMRGKERVIGARRCYLSLQPEVILARLLLAQANHQHQFEHCLNCPVKGCGISVVHEPSVQLVRAPKRNILVQTELGDGENVEVARLMMGYARNTKFTGIFYYVGDKRK